MSEGNPIYFKVKEPSNHWSKCKVCGKMYEVEFNINTKETDIPDDNVCSKCRSKESNGKEKNI